MEEYEKALRFFDAYQRSGVSENLIDALDTLNNIIECEAAESQRANNLKRTILKHIDKELKSINTRYNLAEFNKDLANLSTEESLKKYFNGLLASASTQDARKFMDLLKIIENRKNNATALYRFIQCLRAFHGGRALHYLCCSL